MLQEGGLRIDHYYRYWYLIVLILKAYLLTILFSFVGCSGDPDEAVKLLLLY